MHYDLTDLRVFLAVAEQGNLSRGAERCNLAPSSVSQRIRNLEEAIKAPLLIREARGVRLTPAGHVLFEHARQCVAQLEQMHSDLLPYTEGLVGHVTLFANNNAISSHLPDDIARFFARYPHVRISLEERLSHDIIGAVAAGRADLGVVAFEGEHPELEFLPYRQDQLVILTPLNSPLSGQLAVDFSACLGVPFISLQHGAALHTYLMNHATALGKSLDVRVQVSGYRAIARLVSSGAGIGIVPRSALEEGDSARLDVIELSESWARRDLRVCFSRQSRNRNSFQEKLIEILCEGAA